MMRNKTNRRLINPFPASSTDASYDPFLMSIRLEGLNGADLAAIDRTKITRDNYKFAALIKHELTHWFDHIATLWGQQRLVLLFNALNALATGNENEFWRIKAFEQVCNGDSFPEYFQDRLADHHGSFAQPWRYRITCGTRFDGEGKVRKDKPLLFTQFFTYQDVQFSRMPVSVASILETNAVFEEMRIKAAFIADIPDQHDKAYEAAALNIELESLLYSSDLILYNVIAHLTAKFNGINNPLDTFKISSSIGTLVLNLPPELIAKMNLKKLYHPEWDSRRKAMADNGELGFIYYNLLENLVDKFGANQYTLDRVLEASGFPKVEDLELETLSAMGLNLYNLTDGPFSVMATALINTGMTAYTKRGIDGKKKDFEHWYAEQQLFPHFILGNMEPVTTHVSLDDSLKKVASGQKLSFEEMYALFCFYEAKMVSFIHACGV